MCRVYADQDPGLYASTSRSLRLRGYSTSIRLENVFWEVLDRLSAEEGMSLPDFIATLHDEMALRGDTPQNFTSALRSACVIYLSRPDAPGSLMAAE